jgi:UDP-glucuronate 4-epimerase
MRGILVTGGAGFIGSHLVDRLMADGGYDVTVVDNFNEFYDQRIKRANIEPHLSRDNFELFEADIVDTRAMNELCAAKSFDTIVHLAARAGVRPSLDDPILYQTTNVRGTYSLLEAARNNGVPRFVFGSSSSVYGTNSRLPFSEDDPVSTPLSPYAATKIACEAACHAYSHLFGIQMTCLRFFTAYGARQRPDLAIHKFARMIRADHPIPVYGDGTSRRDYTYIDDIIAGVVAALDYNDSQFEIINLGESETVELNRLIELLEAALGKKAIIDREPAQPGDMPVTFANIEKARRLLGYSPATSIEQGLSKFVEWFEGNRGLMRDSRQP